MEKIPTDNWDISQKPHDLELEQIRTVSLRSVFNQISRSLTWSEI